MKKRFIGIGCICLLIFMMTASVFAATASFSGNLPVKQGDTEVSKVKRATSSSTWMINISKIGTGTSKVCAWTELEDGYNLSSPYKQVGTGEKSMSYTALPAIGKNVVLNLDNPVYMTSTVSVSGKWSPK